MFLKKSRNDDPELIPNSLSLHLNTTFRSVAAEHNGKSRPIVRTSHCPLGSTGKERTDANSGENLHLRIDRQTTPWISLSEAHNSFVNQSSAFVMMYKRKWVK